MRVKTIDIIGENYSGNWTDTRTACRAVIVNDGKLLLSYETKTGQWMLPGGGLEADEDEMECVIREVSEETGKLIEPSECILEIDEYYETCKWINRYFTGKVIGTCRPQLTQREKEVGMEPRWVHIEEIKEVFSRHNEFADSDEMRRGMYLREYTALSQVLGDRDELRLYVPRHEDGWFYVKMMSDPQTMSYNAAWFPPEGCIPNAEKEWDRLLNSWIGHEPERFYGYLQRVSDGAFVGDVCYHKSTEGDWCDMGIVIYAPERGKGYGRQGLDLLLEKAFVTDGVSCLHNDFENTRTTALRIHEEAGFRIMSEKDGIMHLELTREQYLKAKQ